MDIGAINNVTAYDKAAAVQKEEKAAAQDTAKVSGKQEDAAAVYEKTSDKATKVVKADVATIDKMRAELDQKTAQLKSLVEKMLLKQGNTSQEATGSIWDLLKSGKLEVDPATAAQAKTDIAEDGYWGVEQTSERLVSFAKALAGNDPEYADKLIGAMKKGFEDATGEWGSKLPDICQQTIDKAISKMEAWRDGTE